MGGEEARKSLSIDLFFTVTEVAGGTRDIATFATPIADIQTLQTCQDTIG